MSDSIYRQVAIDAFGLSEKTRKYGGDHSGYDTMMLYEIQDVLESLPSADATGKWVFNEDGYFHCEVCGKKPNDQSATTDYCPHCGARLGGEDE